jgi:tRNA A22 N-methylase
MLLHFRPTATELLKHPFFKKAKDRKYLQQTLVAIGPSLETRVQKVWYIDQYKRKLMKLNHIEEQVNEEPLFQVSLKDLHFQTDIRIVETNVSLKI